MSEENDDPEQRPLKRVRVDFGLLQGGRFNMIRFPGRRVLDDEGKEIVGHPDAVDNISFTGELGELYADHDTLFARRGKIFMRRNVRNATTGEIVDIRERRIGTFDINEIVNDQTFLSRFVERADLEAQLADIFETERQLAEGLQGDDAAIRQIRTDLLANFAELRNDIAVVDRSDRTKPTREEVDRKIFEYGYSRQELNLLLGGSARGTKDELLREVGGRFITADVLTDQYLKDYARVSQVENQFVRLTDLQEAIDAAGSDAGGSRPIKFLEFVKRGDGFLSELRKHIRSEDFTKQSEFIQRNRDVDSVFDVAFREIGDVVSGVNSAVGSIETLQARTDTVTGRVGEVETHYLDLRNNVKRSQLFDGLSAYYDENPAKRDELLSNIALNANGFTREQIRSHHFVDARLRLTEAGLGLSRCSEQLVHAQFVLFRSPNFEGSKLRADVGDLVSFPYLRNRLPFPIEDGNNVTLSITGKLQDDDGNNPIRHTMDAERCRVVLVNNMIFVVPPYFLYFHAMLTDQNATNQHVDNRYDYFLQAFDADSAFTTNDIVVPTEFTNAYVRLVTRVPLSVLLTPQAVITFQEAFGVTEAFLTSIQVPVWRIAMKKSGSTGLATKFRVNVLLGVCATAPDASVVVPVDTPADVVPPRPSPLGDDELINNQNAHIAAMEEQARTGPETGDLLGVETELTFDDLAARE